MFSQIHEIVFHGKGGYDWDTVYNMPIWLRRFTFEKLKEFYEKEKEEAEKQQNLLKTNNSKDIAYPNIVSPNNKSKQPTYTYNSKVPKK
jgi:uncharacterized damage-inducible protein DinB